MTLWSVLQFVSLNPWAVDESDHFVYNLYGIIDMLFLLFQQPVIVTVHFSLS